MNANLQINDLILLSIKRIGINGEGIGYYKRLAVFVEGALVGEEVEALYTNGPAGGGGVRKYINEVIGIVSVLVDRSKIKPIVAYFEN